MGKYYRKKTTAVDERKHRRGLRTITIAALLLCAVGVGGVSSFATVWAEDAVVTSTVMDGNKQYRVHSIHRRGSPAERSRYLSG